MKLKTMIDTFVNIINMSSDILDDLKEDEVPLFLRIGEADEYGCYRWKICQRDGSKWIDPLMEKLPKRFPPSYYSLVSRYAFAAMEIKPIMLFANTGENTYWELSSRIFYGKYMSSILLKNGFLQFGNPYEGNYDPVCFDTSRGKREYPIVQIDHESILCHSKIRITKEIAPSFLTFVKEYMNQHEKGSFQNIRTCK